MLLQIMWSLYHVDTMLQESTMQLLFWAVYCSTNRLRIIPIKPVLIRRDKKDTTEMHCMTEK